MTKFARDVFGDTVGPATGVSPESVPTGYDRARVFHEVFGLPINGPGYEPTADDRLLRGKLMIEEVVEHLAKGLGLRVVVDYDPRLSDDAQYVKLEVVSEYDPVETLDGLADVKVIANGTAVVMGLPMLDADWEVFCSNMSKLDDNGEPIVNGMSAGATLPDDPLYRADLPHGKVLKSERYTPANIAGLLGG